MASKNVNTVSVSRVYADVLKNKPRSFFDCETYVCSNADTQECLFTKTIGEGKFGSVYIAKTKESGICVVKILKVNTRSKLIKEIKILDYVKNGTNIVKMLNVTKWPPSNTYALFFELIPNFRNFAEVYLNLNEIDARYYTYEILKGLHYCHSHGIIHRDVKPHNIIIDSDNRRLRIIDFGLADYYKPGTPYTWVGTVAYMAPEVLLYYPYYNYSVDLWALGCILGSMIFKKTPVFGKMNDDRQLYRIAKLLGSGDFDTYVIKYKIPISKENVLLIRNLSKKHWSVLSNQSDNQLTVDDTVCDLLDRILCYDHIERITAQEAMEHKYFEPLKQQT